LDLARLAKGLAHPARAAIVRMLLNRGTCICGDLVDRLPLAQATVSQHLKTLKEAGWITGEVDGPRVCYCVNPKAVERMKALVSRF
jgi:ArsR family transcriptional regulator